MNYPAIAEEMLEIIKSHHVTLRDRFALEAMKEAISFRPPAPSLVALMADHCYEIADAMLAAREKQVAPICTPDKDAIFEPPRS